MADHELAGEQGLDTHSPSLGIVILNWNGAPDTLACLESLRRGSYRGARLIVVDNGSTDRSQEVLRPIEDVELVEIPSNIGVAAALNRGVECALRHGCEFILAMNNDTVVDDKTVAVLMRAIESDGRIGIVAPKMYYYDEPRTIWCAGGRVNRWKGETSHIGMLEMDRGQFDELEDVDYVSGCALLARREVYEALGGYDTAYRVYFEDTDFCLRAQRAGWRVVAVPRANLWHKVSMTVGRDSPNYWSQFIRSRILFVRSNFDRTGRASALAYVVGIETFRMLVHFAIRGKRNCVRPYLSGLASGLTGERSRELARPA